MIYSLGERRIETCGEEFFVAPTASVIGRVRLGRWASVWFSAVLRGDTDWIDIGDGSNVQDGSILHTDAGTPLRVGRNVTIGHAAVLHTCQIGDRSLIANRAMILDGASVGENTIVAAGAVVLPGKSIPSGVVAMGSPAAVVRELTDKDRKLVNDAAEHYQVRARLYREQFVIDTRFA
jgi:carbonic anhydrase/acetyltransferase-like protein (isoleucine patch superfamily)